MYAFVGKHTSYGDTGKHDKNVMFYTGSCTDFYVLRVQIYVFKVQEFESGFRFIIRSILEELQRNLVFIIC